MPKLVAYEGDRGVLVLKGGLEAPVQNPPTARAKIRGQNAATTAPNPTSVQRCIAGALADAGVAPEQVDAINGHLTATGADPKEVDSWAKALKREPGQASMMPYGDLDTTVETVARAVAKGPWFLGERFTALDVYFGSAIRWTMQFGLLPQRSEFTSYAERLAKRPALLRAEERDKALQASQSLT